MNGRSRIEAKAFGEEIALLRSRKRWSRARLLREIDKELTLVGYDGKLLSEAWLNRLENGEVVILHRQVFNALCTALKCNGEEIAKLHLLGDRNVVVVIPGTVTRLAERFNYLMVDVYNSVCSFVENQASNQQIDELTQVEIDELFDTAMELIMADRRAKKKRDN